ETGLRPDAGTKMGHRDGGVRFYRRDVSILRGLAGNRSTHSGRCLYLRLPPATGSVARGSDEITGKDLRREIFRRAKARPHQETHRSFSMLALSFRADRGSAQS